MLIYVGPTTGATGVPVTVSALLFPAVSGAPIVFRLNNTETCTGFVGFGGLASCSITPAEAPGTYPLTASFAGNATHAPSSTTVQFTVTAGPPIPTMLTYVGPTTGVTGTPVTVSALLTPALIGAPIVFRLNNAETCTGTVFLGGFASCSITPTEAPGMYPLTASFAGTPTYAPSSTTIQFTVTAVQQIPTTLLYTGPTSGVAGTPVTVSALLTPDLVGAPIVFTLNNNEACSGTVNLGGFASCSITPTEAPGMYPLTASFAGTPTYAPSSTTVQFTVTAGPLIPTTLVYTGPTTGVMGTPVTVSAMLTPALVGASIVFTLNSTETCTGTVAAGGTASCSLTPAEAPGMYPLTASFAGNATHAPSSTTVQFTVTGAPPIATTLVYTGNTFLGNGTVARLAGVLTQMGNVPLAGRTVNFTLGTGVTAQTCSGVTNATGQAECLILSVQQPLNATATIPIALSYAGEPGFLPASATAVANLEYMTADGVATLASIDLLIGSVDLGPLPGLTPLRTADATPLTQSCTVGPVTASIGAVTVLSVSNVCGSVASTVAPGTATGTASVGSTTVNVLGPLSVIQLGALQSSSTSSCTGSTGSATVASLSIGGINFPVPTGMNATIPLLGGQITFNEQIPVAGADDGLTVTAVHIVINIPGITNVDIALGKSESAIYNCRVGPLAPLTVEHSNHDISHETDGMHETAGTDEAGETDAADTSDEIGEVGGCQSTRADGAAWLIALALVTGGRWRRRRDRRA